MVCTILLLLFFLVTRSISQDIRSMLMSEIIDMKFECTSSNCSNPTNISMSSLIDCQFACLAYIRCRATTFDQSVSQCELFDDISIQYGYLLVKIGVVTMIAIDDGQSSNG